MALCVKPSGRVDQDNIGSPLSRCPDAVEGDGRWICTGLMLDDFGSDVLAPDLQLLDSRRAERISRHKQHLFPILTILRCHLADGRRFAYAVNTQEEHDPGRLRKRRYHRASLTLFYNLDDLAFQIRTKFLHC